MSLKDELMQETTRLEQLIQKATAEKEQAIKDIDHYSAMQIHAVSQRNARETQRCSYDRRLTSVRFLLEKWEEENEPVDD